MSKKKNPMAKAEKLYDSIADSFEEIRKDYEGRKKENCGRTARPARSSRPTRCGRGRSCMTGACAAGSTRWCPIRAA